MTIADGVGEVLPVAYQADVGAEIPLFRSREILNVLAALVQIHQFVLQRRGELRRIAFSSVVKFQSDGRVQAEAHVVDETRVGQLAVVLIGRSIGVAYELRMADQRQKRSAGRCRFFGRVSVELLHAHLPAIEGNRLCVRDFRERGQETFRIELFAPEQHSRKIVARAQRTDAHRWIVQRRVELSQSAENPADGAIAAEHADANVRESRVDLQRVKNRGVVLEQKDLPRIE